MRTQVLQNKTVAVRTIDIMNGDARRNYIIVKVEDVSPDGLQFAAQKEEYSTADIIRVF